MTQPLNPLRRNSFRHITEAQYYDLTLGRVRNVTRENRNGADHITTEFQNGALIMSEQEMSVWITRLITSGFVKLDNHQQEVTATAPVARTPADDDPDDEYDAYWQLRNAQ